MRGLKVYRLEGGVHYEDRVYNVLHQALKDLQSKSIVKFDFFLSILDKEEFLSVKEYITKKTAEIFKDNTPSITILPNSSQLEDGFLLKCYFFEKKEKLKIDYKQIAKHNYVTIDYGYAKEIISGGINFDEDSFLMNCQRAIDLVEQILTNESMNFGNIFKQNNYIHNINNICKTDHLNQTNWNTYSQIQNLFYENSLFKSGFPVTTTVGSPINGLTIDFIAISSNKEISFTINNYLESNIKGRLLDHAEKEIWITNCISNKENTDDIEKQTLNALDNLFSFIDEQNIRKNKDLPLNNYTLKENIKSIDVFVHNYSDISVVTDIVGKVFSNIPKCIIHAPSKNKNTLIEIEALLQA